MLNLTPPMNSQGRHGLLELEIQKVSAYGFIGWWNSQKKKGEILTSGWNRSSLWMLPFFCISLPLSHLSIPFDTLVKLKRGVWFLGFFLLALTINLVDLHDDQSSFDVEVWKYFKRGSKDRPLMFLFFLNLHVLNSLWKHYRVLL